MDVSSIPPSNEHDEAQRSNARPLTNVHPTVWGEFFIHSLASENQILDHAQVQQRVETLKEQVRTMFSTSSSTANDGRLAVLEEEMKLVDAVQRLGLAYHFEKEISDALARIHASQYSTAATEDLSAVSLRFRLLRRGGYNVSSDEFNIFKDAHGHFKRSLSSDVEGLLNMYEASYLGTQEDGILEEAMSFCKRELESMLDHLQHPLAAEVVRALDMPLVRRVTWLEAREYLSFYEATEGRNDVILELAKLDFNRLQALYQEEVRGLTRWWKELGLIEKLNFARDRLVECYVWIVGVHYEPHLTDFRMMMTKVISLVSVLDDIYDSYGTIEELRLLTDVMQRWDIDEVKGLPDYMKTHFMALCDTIKEFELKFCHVQYLKEKFKAQSKAYLKEAEWCNEGYTPTLQEHLQVSLASSGIRLLICGSFIGMGDIATQYIFDWLASNPKIVEASCMIGRLTNDIVATHEFEENRKHVASTLQCYMKEYNVTKEMAHHKLREMANTAWKVMNEEWIQLTQIPTQFRAIPFEFARTMEGYYKSEDGYTHSSTATKNAINLLLVKRIPV